MHTIYAVASIYACLLFFCIPCDDFPLSEWCARLFSILSMMLQANIVGISSWKWTAFSGMIYQRSRVPKWF